MPPKGDLGRWAIRDTAVQGPSSCHNTNNTSPSCWRAGSEAVCTHSLPTLSTSGSLPLPHMGWSLTYWVWSSHQWLLFRQLASCRSRTNDAEPNLGQNGVQGCVHTQLARTQQAHAAPPNPHIVWEQRTSYGHGVLGSSRAGQYSIANQ